MRKGSESWPIEYACHTSGEDAYWQYFLVFETISAGVYKLLSSGGLDFLSVVFIEGIFLLGEHL